MKESYPIEVVEYAALFLFGSSSPCIYSETLLLLSLSSLWVFYWFFLLQDMGEGRNRSNDNPADSAEEAKTSSGACKRIHTAGTSIDGTNDIIQDGVSNTQNQHRLINSN